MTIVLTSLRHSPDVNPFQILEIENHITEKEASLYDSWYMDGDWQDTLQYINRTAKAKIRWTANEFGGHMIFHCHILAHEDKGMMGQFFLEGGEGTVWSGATKIDPTCVPMDQFISGGSGSFSSNGDEESTEEDGLSSAASSDLASKLLLFFSLQFCMLLNWLG